MPRTIALRTKLPIICVDSRVALRPVGSGGKGAPRRVGSEGSCREEIIWNIREELQNLATTKAAGDDRPYWEAKKTLTHHLDLKPSSLKQHGMTTLSIVDEEKHWHCERSCCAGQLGNIMDTLVGNLALVLDPDPHYGEWWQSPSTAPYDDIQVFFGLNNSCLQHPAILHIILGMLRQAYLLFDEEKGGGLLKAVPYTNTKKALNNADWKQAWKNLEAARPWIEVTGAGDHHWPFPKGYWNRLVALHRALYKKGPAKLFGHPDVASNWELLGDNRSESNVDGAWSYFGATNKKLTPAGKRLFQLGK